MRERARGDDALSPTCTEQRQLPPLSDLLVVQKVFGCPNLLCVKVVNGSDASRGSGSSDGCASSI